MVQYPLLDVESELDLVAAKDDAEGEAVSYDLGFIRDLRAGFDRLGQLRGALQNSSPCLAGPIARCRHHRRPKNRPANGAFSPLDQSFAEGSVASSYGGTREVAGQPSPP